ncbi:MAG TPA: rhomboid family intramembrane serine protease, partial [Archangium sp.]
DRHSIASIGGASGAIAGCMGAFALRFALTKIRFHYFLWFIRIMVGEVHVPAWLCGLLWLGRELFDLKDGGAAGVATGAHVGGFMIGGLVAVGMKALGRDSELLTVAESDERSAERDQLFMEASTALARGDAELSREYALSLQAQAPNHPGLAMLQAEADVRANRGVARLEKVLRPMLAKKDGEVERLVSRLWPSLQPEGFSAAFAWQLAERLRDARPPVDSDIPEALLRHVAAGSGSLAIKARALLEPAAPPTPRVLPAKLVTVSREGLQLVVEGAPKLVPFAAVGAVLGGIVPEEGRRALLVDVVLKAPGARTALRLSGSDPAVPPLFPGKPVPDAWRAFIEATRRAANVQPDAAPWAEFSSAEALTDSWGT